MRVACGPSRERIFRQPPLIGKRSAVAGSRNKKAARSGLFRLGRAGLAGKILGDKIPVDQIPKRRNVVGTAVAIVYVVSVFPNVAR